MGTRLAGLDAGADVQKTDQMIVQQAGPTDKRVEAQDLPLPLNYIAGLITSNGTDTDHDIDIAVGAARSVADTLNMKLAAVLTKQIDATWAVGDDAGGMEAADHPVQASTIYALWLIRRSDTGVVDAMFSTDFATPTLPTDYDEKRLIGAVLTDSSDDIVPYIQLGDDFYYISPKPLDVNDSSLVNLTYETGTFSAPPNSIVTLRAGVTGPANSTRTGFLLRPIVGSGSPIVDQEVEKATTGNLNIKQTVHMPIDSNRQLEYTTDCSPSAGSNFVMTTSGFRMTTRRDP